MASSDPWQHRIVQMARDLGIQAERQQWTLFEAARGPYRGLDATLRIARSEYGPDWLVASPPTPVPSTSVSTRLHAAARAAATALPSSPATGSSARRRG
jgi:hypothetical protein